MKRLPSAPSADELHRRSIERRAVEAAIWGMPAVNYRIMYDEMVAKVKGDFNQILYWSRLLDWKNQTLTPNPDVIYLMPFFNTKEAGPIVLEIPPADDGSFTGSIMNFWQAAIEDIGPGGLDKGKGGKYVFMPPGFKGKLPEGYIPMQSDTHQGYALIRSILKSGSPEDVATALAYSKRMKLYPLSKAANPPPTKYVDAAGVVFDSTIRYDATFYATLDKMIQAEPWLERDRAMIDPLKTLGIERGKPFKPNAKTKAILAKAILEARAVLDNRYDTFVPFYPGKRWAFPVTEEVSKSVQAFWGVPESYPTDERGTLYTIAFFSGMHVGESQYYLLTGVDRSGKPLLGSAKYRLRVPAGAPVRQYWSATVYDRETHAFVRKMPRVGRSSQSPGLQLNADGSADIYFGPKAPPGKESNWVPTDPKRRFEVMARFYGPTKALFDKSWQLSDIEKVK